MIEAEELFKNKPVGYEMKPEKEIYIDGFNDGYNLAKKGNKTSYIKGMRPFESGRLRKSRRA